jgi:hypothetical protein
MMIWSISIGESIPLPNTEPVAILMPEMATWENAMFYVKAEDAEESWQLVADHIATALKIDAAAKWCGYMIKDGRLFFEYKRKTGYRACVQILYLPAFIPDEENRMR